MRSYFFMDFLSLKADFIDCRLLITYVLKAQLTISELFKVNNKSTRTSCELCSKLATKASGRCHCSRSDLFIFNFEHFSWVVLMFLLLIVNKYWSAGRCSWNNWYIETWRIYTIKNLSYHVLTSMTNRINSQLFFLVNSCKIL